MNAGAEGSRPRKRTALRFVATEKQREIVTTLAGTLTPHDQIARFLDIGESTLERHFKAELANGRGQLLVTLKQVVVQKALHGSIRAATWLIERLDPQFIIRRDVEAGEGPQTKYIIIRNGLPDLNEAPGPNNNWGEEQQPNGEDVHEAEDGGAPVPGPSVLDQQMRNDAD